MSLTREVAIIFGLILICSSFSQYAGVSFQLTRSINDKFRNPMATRFGWEAKKKTFCEDTNSRCDENCSWCICDNHTSTFDRRVMKCRNDDEIRSGCRMKFSKSNDDEQIKLLDLKKNHNREVYIYWKYTNRTSGDKLKTFTILDITWYDGKVVKTLFFKPGLKIQADNRGNYRTKIQWDKVLNSVYHGVLFRVNIDYEIKHKKKIINIKDCFVFKSSGTINVNFSSLPSTTLKPTSFVPSLLNLKVSLGARKYSTTSKNPASPGVREDEDENDNTVVVTLVVVACIVLIIAVILVIWWKRRQSKGTSKENDEDTIITNTGSNNPMIMSPMESIYAEADNSVNNPQEKEKKSYVYDYATGNLENNYASLDLSKVESDPVYHSLCNSYNQPEVTGECVSGKTPTAERFYHVVESPGSTGTTQYPGGIHNVLDEPEKNDNCKIREVSGRTGHKDEERVYSVLEECAAVNSGTDDNPERVYSVLEDENPESDYLTILGECSEYEQPINPPVSDF
ncbi:uncharacterized protein LOC114521743 isoform X2 [Dendronephthya gigantea]|uniref:uncharacterized protein LOC114521743 isoform X2 n=1 Tax=Dendronephthya gigantea TaxID=151771 RepID=UPI00106C323C|nr:uncharacterized protein LOC114521743 isoform X2 [Dendronephthya gigantea]